MCPRKVIKLIIFIYSSFQAIQFIVFYNFITIIVILIINLFRSIEKQKDEITLVEKQRLMIPINQIYFISFKRITESILHFIAYLIIANPKSFECLRRRLFS
jgi:hypothetical protein